MADPITGPRMQWLIRRRLWLQGLFLLLWLDPLMLRLHTVCGPVFHCYSCPLSLLACPIGVLANFSALHVVPVLAIGTLLLVGASVGAAVCGWACPFGLLQDLGARLPLPRVRLPAWTGAGRYLVLVGMVLLIPFFFGQDHPLFFCRLCPAGALEGALPETWKTFRAGGGLILPNAAKLAILGVVVGGALFTVRPWCRVLCPLGAVFSLFNRGSVLVMRFNQARCRSCGACEARCPYGLTPSRDLDSLRCVRCLECTRCAAVTVGSCLSASSAVADAAEVAAPAPVCASSGKEAPTGEVR